MRCGFCGYEIRGAYVEAANAAYCLGHEPSAQPDEKDQRIAELEAGLRSLRLSIDMLAKASNVPDFHIVRIERGEVDPSATTLADLAKGLKCTVDDLLDDRR